ncbi:hypothetical protein A2W14_04735 [Candidatus Gottesmanbacteria bacterium RBG_16_37_8]|uniref:Phosphoribosyltransferase domain-containing protein n=1 Tax=Candidatus Gottesmanbacteria bacterium RBG_16_37_8 TaxID=1798371 RepID=A0A1F5YUC1_9BACT|nr:MAG: hypothetical protein A2W14_04735 [Candidatus Gottesmanbacteria bacterium RBG_16_37_8]
MFQNRQSAGRQLAERLEEYRNNKETIVLAIPRGGVVVGKGICEELNLPLEAVSVKKLGAPFNPELAIGAVAMGGNRYIDWEMIKRINVDSQYLDPEVKSKLKETEERVKKYKIKLEHLLNFSNFILTDDGVATGATTKAALSVIVNLKITSNKKKKIILAVPVISNEVSRQLEKEVSKLIAIEKALDFGAVGQFYNEFHQIDDKEVVEILEKLRRY